MFAFKQLALMTPVLLLVVGAEKSAMADERATSVAATARSLITLGEPERFMGVAVDPTIIARRSVTLDRQLLRALPERTVATIRFDLLADVSVVGEIAKLDVKGQGRFVASGPLANDPGSWFTIVARDDAVVGNIRSPLLGSYQIRPTGAGGHELRKIDETLFLPCATEDHNVDSPTQEVVQVGAITAGACGADDGSQIDMLVVYTVAARNTAGGTAAIEAIIALAEAETNQGYVNSQVDTRLRVVATAEVDYAETGKNSATIINELTRTDDGYLDEVHSLREVVQADVVSMLVDALSVVGRANISILPGNVPIPELAFNIVNVNAATANYTFGHELGHNQGLRHNREADPTEGAFPYSHGYVEPSGNFSTIMGVGTPSLPGPQTRIQYFSNPDLLFEGAAMGVPITEPDSAHSTLSINNTAFNVANFRRSNDCNWNGDCDDAEVADGTAADCNGNGTPDDCELDCNGNGQPDDCDIATGFSNDCNNNGKPDDCEADCNQNGVEDSCDVANNTSSDCNSNLVPDDCEPGGLEDCNTNGVIDLCDIFNNTATDCDGNAVPDTCDVADGSGPDCNGNGILDDCDLLLPTSNDTNFNGLLDECEQNACGLHKIFASDAADDDMFGSAVSVSGDVGVVGAYATDDAGEASGSAYVFRWDPIAWRWVQEAKLVAFDAAPGDHFGRSVAIDGELVLVGAEDDDNDVGIKAGSAYLFRWNAGTATWVEETKLIASDGAGSDHFGTSVSIDGDTALIGAPAAEGVCAGVPGCNSGAAYVFRWNPGTSTWVEEAKLIASDAAADDFAGIAVSLDADKALIGAIGSDDACPNDPACNSGAAYVFRWNSGASTWVEEGKLTAVDLEPRDHFGVSVSVDGDLALLGASSSDGACPGDPNCDSGTAYIFRRAPDTSSWTEEAKLTGLDTAAGDQFGGSVSVSGSTALVGASLDRHEGAALSGSVYAFQWNGASWVEEMKLVAWDTDILDMFGVSVSLNGGRMLIGAEGDDDAGDSSGSAYIFTLGGTDCDGDGFFDVCDLPGVATADCNATGVVDFCDITGGVSSDCNINGVPDDCEIAAGTSLDCTVNGVPDECEPDCNLNGVADSCDLADMTSDDVDASAIPDECEPLGCQLDTLAVSGTAVNGPLGTSVSISGDVIVWGVPTDDDACPGNPNCDSGAVYVSRWNPDASEWIQEAKLTAPDAVEGGLFGKSVSVSGDRILVAALSAVNNFAGLAYVFHWSPETTEWTHEATILPPDPFVMSFASSVSISGNVAIVGTSDVVGSAYIFRRKSGTTEWTKETRLYAPIFFPFDLFGVSVSISDDVALVGAQWDDDACTDDLGCNSGAAYVFRRFGPVWLYEAKLTASDAVADHGFGFSVSIRNDLAVVGTVLDDDACPGNPNCDSGAAYIFRRNGTGWIQEVKLTDSSPEALETFGASVALGADVVCVGAPRDDHVGSESGSVSVFRWNGATWVELQKVTALETGPSDKFGSSVSLSGNVVVTSNDPTSGASSAYVFAVGPVPEITPDCDADGLPDHCEVGDCNANGIVDDCDLAANTSLDCNDNSTPDECDIAFGFSEDCTGDGIPDECDPDCNANDTADSCDINAGTSHDCNANGIPDDCDIAAGLPDVNGDGIPDVCVPEVLLPADPPNDLKKNRYISFDPNNNVGQTVKLRVTLTSSIPHPALIGSSWWVQPPVVTVPQVIPIPLVGPGECVALLGTELSAAQIDWDAAGCQTLHVTGCPIEPTSEYDVQAVIGTTESAALTVATILQPGGGKWWGDTVGIFNGVQWTPPNLITNIDDVSVAIKTFQGGQVVPPGPVPPGNVAHLSVADVDAGDNNLVVNFNDVLKIVLAFKGNTYPFGPADTNGNCP